MISRSPDGSGRARVAGASLSALICRAVPLFTDGKIDSKKKSDKDPVPEQEYLYCAVCHHKITQETHKISVQGKDEYTFFNPGGILFHIGCFQEAAGCVAQGVSTTEFSWFPGFFWQIAYCSACREHLGWLFSRGTGEYFFGLVLARLRSGSESSMNLIGHPG
ncbi:MAG: hypothetical protein HQL87_18085 [Magnetococcales bacterium]|nr:hypothetical protein [Magnetococcales bacterium]